MKYIFAFILFIFTVTCRAQEGFTIKGTVEGSRTGNICLISLDNPSDTLAHGTINDGYFNLTGKTPHPQISYIRIQNVLNGPHFFLENTHFMTHLKITKAFVPNQKGQLVSVEELNDELNSDIQGGNDQRIANQYWKLLSQVAHRYDTLRTLYDKAEKNNDQTSLKFLEEKDKSLRKHLIQEAKTIIRQYKDSYVSAYIIQEHLSDLYEEQADILELYQLLGESARNSVYGRKIAANLSSNQTPQEGEIMPDFTLTNLDNTPQSLHELKGKIKILDFWAGWCTPCLDEMPKLLELYNQKQSEGIEVITITLDKDQHIAQKLKEKLNLTWISLGRFQSTDTNLEQIFHIHTIPYKIILDQNNHIIQKGNLSLNNVRECIEKLQQR